MILAIESRVIGEALVCESESCRLLAPLAEVRRVVGHCDLALKLLGECTLGRGGARFEWRAIWLVTDGKTWVAAVAQSAMLA